jgi:hypothetical protein
MNKTTILTITAVLVAAAVVIGTFASPALADSSSTTTVQTNKQKQTISGDVSVGVQLASNCIAFKNIDGNASKIG